MIARITREILGETLRFSLCPQWTVKILAGLSAYGADCPFFEAFVHNGQSLLGRLDGNLTLFAGPGADFEELAAFAASAPRAGVYGEAGALRELARFLGPGVAIEDWNLMLLPDEAGPAPEGALLSDAVIRSPELREMAPLLWGPDGPPPETYADVSHRLRHGCALGYLLTVKAAPAACCLAGSLSDFAGLLNGLVTLPSFRGRGFGSALVRAVCRDLRSSGRRPVLECADALVPFYRALGFVPAGRASRLFFRKSGFQSHFE